MKCSTKSKLLFAIFTLLLSGNTLAVQNSSLANLQQGVIIAPCMYALLNGETEPQAYNIVMNQENDALTFIVSSVELAEPDECNEYSAPIKEAGSLGLDADDIIPLGCEDINNSIADAIENAMSDINSSQQEESVDSQEDLDGLENLGELVTSLITDAIDSSLIEAAYTCESVINDSDE